jgi:lysozyme
MNAKGVVWARRITLVVLCVMVLQLLLVAGVSNAAPATRWHRVRWGENLTWIARWYGTTVWAIAQANGISNINWIYAGQWLRIPGSSPAPGQFYHVVRYGETLSGIAWRYGRSVWSIANANGIWNIHLIYAGQRLLIP